MNFLGDGRHWADVLGCDMRAGLAEIQRAATRRSNEAMATMLGPALSVRLLEIGEAVDVATRATKGRRKAGSRSRLGA